MTPKGRGSKPFASTIRSKERGQNHQCLAQNVDKKI
jgi:hypothetical protein